MSRGISFWVAWTEGKITRGEGRVKNAEGELGEVLS